MMRNYEHYVIADGFWLFDELHYPNGKIIVLPPVHNKLQKTFTKLLAGLVTNKDTVGIKYMDTGSGDPGWDAAPPPPVPSDTETGLLASIARSTAMGSGDFVYLVEPPTIPETPSTPKTGRIRGQITFSTGTSNGVLREAALFGGTEATGTQGTGILVNVFRHVTFEKPAGGNDFNLVRQFIIQFS